MSAHNVLSLIFVAASFVSSLALLPASSVHAPMTYTGPAIQAEGGGWSQALAAVGRLRQQDRPAG